MDLDKLIISIVTTVSGHRVEGRKRLQKFIHLLKEAGVEVSADYVLHKYGPYSEDVAAAAETLVSDGELEELIEHNGVYQTSQSHYSLTNESRPIRIGPALEKLIINLDKFSTTELEVASTIAFFESEGHGRKQAIKETQYIKPNKAIPRVLGKAEEALELVSSYQYSEHY